MPGSANQPLRKKSTVLQLRKDVYEQLKPLQNNFNSFSQLVEIVTFWVQDLFVNEGVMIIYTLRDILARQSRGRESLSIKTPTRRTHVTIDCEAAQFLDMLSIRYPQVFRGPSQAANACALYALQFCCSYEEKKHLLRRLEQVHKKHCL